MEIENAFDPVTEIDLLISTGKVVLKVAFAKREAEQIMRELGPDDNEIVLMKRHSKFWNQGSRQDRPDGILLVTNKRVAFVKRLDPNKSETEFLSFPFEVIEDLKKRRILLVSPAIEFTVAQSSFCFTLLSDAEEVRSTIEHAMEAN